MRRGVHIILIILILKVALTGRGYAENREDIIFQTSTLNALLDGVYDGNMSIGKLKAHGGFGVGTFNNLDGEMIGLNGVFYQITSDGVVHIVPDLLRTPFAVVKFFEKDLSHRIHKPLNCTELKKILSSLMPTENIFYAIKIEGTFNYIQTRSVPAQTKPYPPLTDVIKHQPTFEFNNVNGTMVGFWLPDYLSDINSTGFHFHFLTADKTAGGHLLECETDKIRIDIDYSREIQISLPYTIEFNNADLNNPGSGK